MIQKIVTLSTHAELVALARTIMPLGSELMKDKTGPHLLMKVVDILVSASCRSTVPGLRLMSQMPLFAEAFLCSLLSTG